MNSIQARKRFAAPRPALFAASLCDALSLSAVLAPHSALAASPVAAAVTTTYANFSGSIGTVRLRSQLSVHSRLPVYAESKRQLEKLHARPRQHERQSLGSGRALQHGGAVHGFPVCRQQRLAGSFARHLQRQHPAVVWIQAARRGSRDRRHPDRRKAILGGNQRPPKRHPLELCG